MIDETTIALDEALRWYRRSLDDRYTHRKWLGGDGDTLALCGASFTLWGEWVASERQEIIFLGVSGRCNAAKVYKSLFVRGESLLTDRVSGFPRGEGGAW